MPARFRDLLKKLAIKRGGHLGDSICRLSSPQRDIPIGLGSTLQEFNCPVVPINHAISLVCRDHVLFTHLAILTSLLGDVIFILITHGSHYMTYGLFRDSVFVYSLNFPTSRDQPKMSDVANLRRNFGTSCEIAGD